MSYVLPSPGNLWSPITVLQLQTLVSPHTGASANVPSGRCLVITSIDTFFYGEGAGGYIEFTRNSGSVGPRFWFTQPSGGNIEWAQWSGFKIFQPGEALGYNTTSGDWDVTCCGWMLPTFGG